MATKADVKVDPKRTRETTERTLFVPGAGELLAGVVQHA
jgi:hypothetical protein